MLKVLSVFGTPSRGRGRGDRQAGLLKEKVVIDTRGVWR